MEWLSPDVSRLSTNLVPHLVASGASLVHMVSVWTTVVITVDRYAAVCVPGDVQLRTVRRAKVATACVAAVSTVCCLRLVLHLCASISVWFVPHSPALRACNSADLERSAVCRSSSNRNTTSHSAHRGATTRGTRHRSLSLGG